MSKHGETLGGVPSRRVGLQLAAFSGDAVSMYPLPARGEITIGRSKENDIQVHDVCVSRRHAVLRVGPTLQLERVSRTNRLYVSSASDMTAPGGEAGARREVLDRVELALGDSIFMGSTTFLVRRAVLSATFDSGSTTVSFDEQRAVGSDDMFVAPGLRPLLEQAKRVARSSLHVVIMGEAGVGKEVLARAIHRNSPRADRPFLMLSCTSLPEVLLESELFGHERGAFPEAITAKPGVLERAAGGSIFLDDVEALPVALQGRLRVALEQGKVFRVGGATAHPVDVRILAASRRDLRLAAERRAFQDDLWLSLSGVCFVIPPLRERVGDIAALAASLVETACRKFKRAGAPALSAEVLAHLEQHPWPGNMTELRNTLERAVLLCADDALALDYLPDASPAPRVSKVPAEPGPAGPKPRDVKVIFFSANPSELTRLALDGEYREVDRRVESALYADALVLISKPAAQIGDLQPALNRYRPTIVHFSGHGCKGEQIILTGSSGEPQAVGKEALVSLFRSSGVRLVVLNACFSGPEAEAIASVTGCAIGMKTAVGDKAATQFSAALYAALAGGFSVKDAFEQGKTALRLYEIPETDVPELVVGPGVDPAQLVFVGGPVVDPTLDRTHP